MPFADVGKSIMTPHLNKTAGIGARPGLPTRHRVRRLHLEHDAASSDKMLAVMARMIKQHEIIGIVIGG